MRPLLRVLLTAELFALALACSGGPADRSLVTATGTLDAELRATCVSTFKTWGDAAPKAGWVEHCDGYWIVEGQPAPVPANIPGAIEGTKPIAAISSEAHRSVATTTDGQTWWVHYVGPQAGWFDGEYLFKLPPGPPDLEAYGGLSVHAQAQYDEVKYAPKRRLMLDLVRELDGEAALVDVLTSTLDRSPDGSADDAWLGAAQGLSSPAKATLIQTLRAKVVGPDRSLAALARLIGLDERAAAADPEIAALAWTMARQAVSDHAPLRVKDIHAERYEPVPLAGRLLTTLFGGDAFGAQPEASPFACELLRADPLALSGPLLAAALSATTRGPACPLDQAWLDATQVHEPGGDPAYVCFAWPAVSDAHVEGPACRARLDAIVTQVPVEGGVGDVTRDPCNRTDGEYRQPLHPAAAAWYYAASRGLDASTSRFDRLTYDHVTGPVDCEGAPRGTACKPNDFWTYNVCSAPIDDLTISGSGAGMNIAVDHQGRKLTFTAYGP